MGDMGLQIALGMDNTGFRQGVAQAGADLSGFGAGAISNAGKDLAGFGDAADTTNRALINNTQSVRLLASEFGIALPRAVSSAVGRMIPAINMIGPALLGAFAVESVVKFGEMVANDTKELYGFKEAQEAMSAAEKENVTILEKQAHASKAFAQAQMVSFSLGIGHQERYVQLLHDWEDSRVKWLGWFGEEGMKLSGATEKIKNEEKSLADMKKLHDSLVNILHEDEVKEQDDALKGLKERQREEERLFHLQAEQRQKTIKTPAGNGRAGRRGIGSSTTKRLWRCTSKGSSRKS